MYLYPTQTDDTKGLETELQDSTFCEECWPDCELTQHFTKGHKTHLQQFSDKLYELSFTYVSPMF